MAAEIIPILTPEQYAVELAWAAFLVADAAAKAKPCVMTYRSAVIAYDEYDEAYQRLSTAL